MFAGLYHVKYLGLLERDTPAPHMDEVWTAGSSDVYDVMLAQPLGDLVGRLFIDWGPAFRVWIQKADQQDKQITELRTKFEEPDFPGFLNFIKSLSESQDVADDLGGRAQIFRGNLLAHMSQNQGAIYWQGGW